MIPFAGFNPLGLAIRARRIVRRDGMRRAVMKLFLFLRYGKGFREALDKRDYDRWMRINENRNVGEMGKVLDGFTLKPKISVIVPVYNVAPQWLDRCIRSVDAQYYENWELCLYDDASSAKETIDCLKKWEGKGDPRIKIRFGRQNLHISGASNEALKMATGEFVALLDHDDELSPDALFENAKAINHQPDADMIYSDEDKISEKGARFSPFFKPSWSLDLLLSHMYTGHLGVYRKSIVDRIGGFRVGYEGSQDYDLVLRFIEKTREEKILHIPRILYHWRTLTASTARSPESKNYAYEAGKKAISAYLDRQGETAVVEMAAIKGNYRITRRIVKCPKISIVVFSQDPWALSSCLKSILRTTTYESMEIIAVGAEGTADVDSLRMAGGPEIVVIERGDIRGNAARALNLGAIRSGGEHLLFLHERIEAIEAGWLDAMIENIQRKEIGIVGGKILTGDKTIVSAGLVLSREQVAVNAFEHFKDENVPYFGHHHVARNCSAVPAVCLMIKRGLFSEAAGFDEDHLPTAYHDVDLCLKVMGMGYRILYTPYARLVLHEEKTERKRGNDGTWGPGDANAEEAYIKKKWRKIMGNDPYYSPNLSADGRFNINRGKSTQSGKAF